MEGTTQAIPSDQHPTPVRSRPGKARRASGVTASSVLASNGATPEYRAATASRSRFAGALKMAAVALLGGLLFAGVFAVMPHGQKSRGLDDDDARVVATDKRRPPNEAGAALLRLYYSIFVSLDAFEDTKAADGELGANSRALIQKLKARIDQLAK